MKPRFSIFAIAFSAAFLSVGCTLIGSGNGGGEDLALTLSSDRSTYSQGDPVQVTLSLRNEGSDSLLINTRMAANQGSAPKEVREVEFVITDPSGQTIPLGARINVRLPAEDDYGVLAPGRVISRIYNLESLFSLEQRGTYTVHATYQNSQDPPSGKDAWKGEVESNTVVLTFE